ncbi:MAG TPA: amidophosphoribosyltransferase [Candidatus Yaniella excrementigallinarum]|nr:amidophosphoribosyltransferase [Candidatus Yaniella excrementigallinarum]
MNQDFLHDSPKDACGVFGVWAPGEEVSKLTYYGLFSLQHRGQESAGIAVSTGQRISVYKDIGLVSQVFDETTLSSLTGHIAIGHCRYGSHGADEWHFAQPTLGATADDGTVALGMNGALTNRDEIKTLIAQRFGEIDSGEMAQGNTSDTALITTLLHGQGEASLDETAPEIFAALEGAFSIVMMSENTLYAARDRHAFRPLVLGRLANGWVVASEQAALATTGATFIREIAPGEMLAIDADGVRSTRFASSKLARCIFEYVYVARPDAAINGRSVYESRLEMGRQLAQENTAEADVVVPVPDSGTPAAIGYAEESGIPLGNGFVKNSYVGRTFIKPSQTLRQLGIRLKLNVQPSVVAGKSVIVVDDSIVRGNTQRQVVAMLRAAGAREVHVKISSPPVKWPCFYGIDFATRAELIATGAGLEEIRTSVGADSLAYISLEGTIAATQQDEQTLCTACFSGNYPTDVPQLTKDRK